jgi:hypothetical protein
MLRIALAALAVISLSTTFPGAANARDGSSAGLRLQAKVQPFCRIRSDLGDSPAALGDGGFDLGSVREVCNTRGGYSVAVQFLNVTSGTLHHGEDSQTLDAEGRTEIKWSEARARTAPWRLTDAALRAGGEPVYMRISISPL